MICFKSGEYFFKNYDEFCKMFVEFYGFCINEF